MALIDRFIKYVKIDTESDSNSTASPSTSKQLDLAKVLVEELKELGIEDVELSKKGIVYACLKGDTNLKTVGFIAHMDTSPDMSGKNVSPRIIKNYDGGTIVLNQELNIVMKPEDFPSLKTNIGDDLIVTDGTTLLGADDKAGISEIMDMIEFYVKHPEIKRGDIRVAFTPDEEIGRGVENFDVASFRCDYAYTVDGGLSNVVSYENFNAASCTVHIQGSSVHPGDAKNKMKNSILFALEFQSLLPTFDNPAYTSGYEGFNHVVSINGTCEESTMNYIIRNHDQKLLEKQKNDFINSADFMNKKYGQGSITLEIKDSYKNMRSYIEKDMRIIDIVRDAMLELGMTPVNEAIRGGTDGAMLTYMGLPCPNLGTGGYLYHGKYEYASIQQMEKCRDLVVKIVENVAKL